jgi:hydroxypyruvate isomerase
VLSRRVFGKLMASTVLLSKSLPAALASSPEPTDRFSVMIWTLKKNGSFEENLERVAHAGFRHVELVGEFLRWSSEENKSAMARMDALGISVDATSGMKLGFADPGGADAFIAELKQLMEAAQHVRCRRLILLSGKRLSSSNDEAQKRASIETLKRAADVLEAAGMDAVIEPIDRLENPSIWMDGVEQAFAIAQAVGSPKVKVLYDLYHEQRSQGNLIEKLEKNIDAVGLIHVADVPGRHEPGTGEINYGNIYRRLGELHYNGMIAMEFYPTGDVVETLRRARMEAAQALVQSKG